MSPLLRLDRLAQAKKWVLCKHPERNRVGGNDYLECQDCGFQWDYRREYDPLPHAVDALIAAALSVTEGPSALTQFSDKDQRDLLELMRFVRYDKHTLLKALTFLRDNATTPPPVTEGPPQGKDDGAGVKLL